MAKRQQRASRGSAGSHAPLSISFNDHDWVLVGTKRGLKGVLADVTGVPAVTGGYETNGHVGIHGVL